MLTRQSGEFRRRAGRPGAGFVQRLRRNIDPQRKRLAVVFVLPRECEWFHRSESVTLGLFVRLECLDLFARALGVILHELLKRGR